MMTRVSQTVGQMRIRIIGYVDLKYALTQPKPLMLRVPAGYSHPLLAQAFSTTHAFLDMTNNSSSGGGGGDNRDEDNKSSGGGSGPKTKPSKKPTFDVDGYCIDLLDNKGKSALDNFKQVMEKNSYYEKYKEKIVRFQHTSPKIFNELISSMISAGKQAMGEKKKKIHVPQKKNLDEIFRMENLYGMSREDISFIWVEYHRSNQMLGGTMNSIMHDRVVAHGKTYPNFLLPLPRNNGFEFFYLEFGSDAFYLAPLARFHQYAENAPVSLSVIHYPELRDSKDIVLVRGERDTDYLSLKEAAILMIQLNLYYGEPTEHRLYLLETFNKRPEKFNYNDLIEEYKRMKLLYPHLFPDETD